MTHRNFWRFLLAASCAAAPANAQHERSATVDDPFTLPSMPWQCGFVPLTQRDSAKSVALLYHVYEERPERVRDIRVAYDSRETPKKMTARVAETANIARSVLRTTSRTTIVWFGDSKKRIPAVGFRSLSSWSPMDPIPDTLTAASGWERISGLEVSRARGLAIWLHDHVCRKPPPGSKPPTR
jgi:hypothetical protein